MLVFGLVHDRGGWEPPPEDDAPPPPRPVRTRRVPWRPLAWVLAWCWLMALVPVASSAFGGLAGYAVLMAAVGLALWGLDRWCARQYWHGLRNYKL